jgi:hypothetical protein
MDTHRPPPEREEALLPPSSSVASAGQTPLDVGSLDTVFPDETTATAPEIDEDDPNLFDYNYTPPSNSIVRSFDPVSQLRDQLEDLTKDSFNTLTTDTKKGEIRICSLNINGLTDTKLGLLLNYT